jgi:hypothetical protein
VAELDGVEPEQEPGREEPEEPPAEVDLAVRLQAHDQCNPQSGLCCSGAASAVCTVVEEEMQNRNRHRHTSGVASKHSTYPPLPPCPKLDAKMLKKDRTNMSHMVAAVAALLLSLCFS